MNTSDFDFELPPERIAQVPVEPRDHARLLVWDAQEQPGDDLRVKDLPSQLRPGDLLVLNDTRVLHARVLGQRSTGGRVEALFLEPVVADLERGHEGAWRAMVKPAKKMVPGSRVLCADGVELEFLVREPESGYWRVRLVDAGAPVIGLESVQGVLARVGAVPLPPYIDRAPTAADEERYQTVYATKPGAVAAPTAGLHLTPELLGALEAGGVETARVTLHVGAGTFLPVTVDAVEEHRMHSERFELTEGTASAVARCRAVGGRVVAVGTTSARVLESCAVPGPGGLRAVVEPGSGSTDIFLRPGSGPRVCDGLLTNFHLPKSTLLMLVAAFIGLDEMHRLYRKAIEERYRFYSYGDASLLWCRESEQRGA